jgi:hypothetical protein
VNATNTQKIIAATLAGLLWLAAIAGMHFFPDVKDALIAFALTCSSIIMLITGAHMNGQAGGSQASATPAAPAVAPGQGGFIAWSMMWLLLPIALGAALLSGCTTTTASMYAGLATQAKAGIQVFDDNTLATMHDLLCAQPYSAIQRHPEMQAGIQQLCGPLANASSLDAGQLQLLMSVVGKAQAAGLLAAPPAAAASGSK